MNYLFRKCLVLFSFILLTSQLSFSTENETEEKSPSPTVFFMSVGGGYDFTPGSSQVVLEANMNLFSDLTKQYSAQETKPVEIKLFGGGNDPTILDILEKDPNFRIEDEIFSSLFNNSHRGVNSSLRHNNLENLKGAASASNIYDFLEMTNRELAEGDEFRFYYTGHGGKSENFTNNTLGVWDGETNVTEFVDALDVLFSKNLTQVMMVQCFSGGFANMNYIGGNPQNELSTAPRCGFFSQVKEKTAAGCTPDVLIREEYSPYFFAAYAGHNEKGEEVQADYDGNGYITSDEAHAYVVIHENAQDLPITTSSQLLRDQNLHMDRTAQRAGWQYFETRLNPIELATLQGLQEKIGYKLEGLETPLKFVNKKIKEFSHTVETLEKSHERASHAFDDTIKTIHEDLRQRFPIFFYPFGPHLGPNYIITAEQVKSAKEMMLKHPEYERALVLLHTKDEAQDVLNQWQDLLTKWQRVGYLLETKIFETLLELSDKENVKEKYQQLKDCESKPFFSKSN